MKLPCVVPCHSFWNKLFGSKSADFENEALEVHNEYRREHGVPPLKLNKEMCKISQKWAEELAKKNELSYSVNKKYGENVYSGISKDPNVKISARDCVEKWYSQINDHSFGREPEVLTTGLFTQVVWKGTSELGIGCAKSSSGVLYVVANYNPPGNYGGQFTSNVLPPGAGAFKSTYRAPVRPVSQVSEVRQNITTVTRDLKDKWKISVDDDFEAQFLNAHNKYRRLHGVAPLTISKKLNKYADEWAKVLVKKDKMEHRSQNTYGENIFYAWSTDPNYKVTGNAAVDNWYDEIKIHTFGAEPTNLDSGHFTQVIWSDCKEVGYGYAKSNNGKIFVVANYYPPGNIVGSFATKVPPLL